MGLQGQLGHKSVNKTRSALAAGILLPFFLAAGFYAVRLWFPKFYIQQIPSISSAITVTAKDPNRLFWTLQDRLSFSPPPFTSIIDCLNESRAWKSRSARAVALGATIFLQIKAAPNDLRVSEGMYDDKKFAGLTNVIMSYILSHSHEIKEDDDYGLMVRKAIETQLRLLNKQWISAKYESILDNNFIEKDIQENVDIIRNSSLGPSGYQAHPHWFP